MTYKIENNDLNGNYVIEISLDDDCNNGHEAFSVTATFWEIGKSRVDRNMITGGCCHDEILKIHPELKIFVDLHLSDFEGNPMYAIENGFYHREVKEAFMNYLRLTEEEANELMLAEDETHLYIMLDNHGIFKRWYAQAKIAIDTLRK